MPNSDESLAILRDKQGRKVALKEVNVRARLHGLLAEVEVEQSYKNPQMVNIEAIYTFPLPIGAVLLGLHVEIAGKILSGHVVERKEAERSYEDAITDGESALMLQEAGPGLYTASIGNLMANESAVIRYRYGLMLSWQGSKLRLLLPTTIAPRYGDAAAAGLQPHQVPKSGLDVEYPFSLLASVEGELATGIVSSPSHSVTVERTESGIAVRLAGNAALDRDFVLNLESDSARSACIHTQDKDGYVAAVSLRVPPVQETMEKPLSLRIVIDCSGSMAGTSIAQARKACLEILNLLRPKDRFNITLFGSTCRHVFRKSVLASAKNITKAWNHLEGLDANMGGTEMENALKSAFALSNPDDHSCVLLITDGEIHEHEKVVQIAKASNHRVFAVGVGNAVSEVFLKSLSRETGGSCELVAPQEGMCDKILNQFHRFRQPQLEKLHIVWPSEPVWSTALPDTAFAGDTIHVFAGFNRPLTGELVLHASVGDGTFDVFSPVVSCEEKDLPRIAAAKRVETATEAQGLQLSLDYQLLSRWTSYLVIVERDIKAGDLPELHQVPQMLAAGWGAVGQMPSVLRRANDKDTIHTSCDSDINFELDLPSESEHDHLSTSSLDIELQPSSGHQTSRSTPKEFIARVEAEIADFQRAINLPCTVQNLCDFGLNEDWATFLLKTVKSGHDEGNVVATFIYALSESAAGYCFRREFKRLALKNWKDSGCNEPTTNQFLSYTMNVTGDSWGSAPERLSDMSASGIALIENALKPKEENQARESRPPVPEQQVPQSCSAKIVPTPIKSTWLVRLHGLTTLIYALMAISCLVATVKGLGSLPYSEDEKYTAGICQLPTDILYKYLLIGRVNEHGSLVARLWLTTQYYGYEPTEVMVARLGSGFSDLRQSLEKSVNQNFNLHLADIRPMDKDILLTINQYKSECSESRRRSTFSERLNDLFHYVGIASLLALSTWLFYMLSERLERKNKLT